MTNIRRSAHALANSPSSEGRTTGCGHLPLSSRPRRLSKRRALHPGFGLSGSRGRARTFNLRINGPLLYQLRYTTLVREEGFEPPETRCRRFYGPVAYSRMATGAGIEPAASSSSHSRSTGELHRSRGLLGLKFSGGGPAGVEPAVGLPRPLLRRLRLPIPPRTHLRYLVSPAGVEPAPPFRKTSFSGWRVFV